MRARTSISAQGWPQRLLACALSACLAAGICPLPAWADVQVNYRKDKVILEDGSEVPCIVVMQTPRGVLIIVANPKDPDGKPIQKIIPAEKVKEVQRGPDEGKVKGFQTSSEQAQKVVQGSGFREQERKPVPEAPVIPQGKIGKLDTSDLTMLPGETTTPQPKLVSNTKLDSKEVADAYLARFPQLGEIAGLFMGNRSQVQTEFKRAMEGDAQARRELESYLNLFLPTDTPVAAPVQARPQPTSQTGPKKVPVQAPPKP
ncbi:MAG: hypothetical protein HS116_01615 [Planctomycetes bacterium]|nr:hypothetical protein [Planctomycetota bacterium]